ncbi:MAG: prepilin-type N-terminal cleavage/methylation domain-containing protein [Candidatus Brocadiales bacterium]|nr:prepilin-type N-terminal cleavage/methylation domain-containing protein [Candidatus Brocadiales bacterium]
MRESKRPLPEERVGAYINKRDSNANEVVPFRDEFKKQSCVSAFTLLELIIAISIGTVLILLVSFAIRMGFFQMERGSKWLEERYRDNSALYFFHQQVTSLRSELINEDIIFDGNSDRIVFITPISLERSYGLGLMLVSYYIEESKDGSRLNYKEKRFVPGKNLDTFQDQNALIFDDSEVVEIVNGYDEISFQYLGLQKDADATSGKSALEWKDEWLENSLPKAVKVVLTKAEQSKELIAPVMVMY